MNRPSITCPCCVVGVIHVGAFGYACDLCGGLGRFSVASLAEWLKEKPHTVRSYYRKTLRPEARGRVEAKLGALVKRYSKPTRKPPRALPLPKGRKRSRQGELFA